jgi:molybdopterin-containing oxidoreductase family iron-sulfur binding subunit
MSSDNKLSRRSFLKVVGATGVAASCSPKPAVQKLYPYLTPPEEIIPGTPTFYRTLCRACPAGCSVTARTREGRVIKLEGNPEDPISGGALCARGQTTVQQLYAADRLRGPMQRDAKGGFAAIGWDQALQRVANELATARAAKRMSGLRFLTRAEPGSAGALQRAFVASVGAKPEQRVVLEPFDMIALRAAGKALFGREEMPAFDLRAARSVVSFGADFLETWLSPVELTRGFVNGRGRIGPDRTRLTWIGPRLSATAGSADVWLRARAGSEANVALGILRWLVDPKNGVSGLRPEAKELLPLLSQFSLAAVEKRADVPGGEILRICEELAQRRPSALLGPGPSSAGVEATQLATAIQLINYVLGNIGQTVLYGLDPLEDPPSSYSEIQSLIAEMAAGAVNILFVHHADPAGTLPSALGAAAALDKVGLVISFSDRLDATTQRAHLILPDSHPLESFGDISPRKGLVQLGQPAMIPLWDTRAASQSLIDVSQKLEPSPMRLPFQDFREYLEYRSQTYATMEYGDVGDLAARQRTALQRGGYRSPPKPEAVALRIDALGPFAMTPNPSDEGLALVPFPTVLRGDGGMAHLPWLKEVPDVTSTVSWTSWAELSPATAARLGVETEDVVALTTSAGTVELTAYTYPGLRNDAVALPLGGPEALALIPSLVDPASGGLAWLGARAMVRKTGKKQPLPRLEGMPEPKAGEVIKHVSSEAPVIAPPPPAPQMYPVPEHPKHRWAMAIDLDRCTGCMSCVVACYAENNVPVLGPEFALQGRQMAWLRIERYFEPGSTPGIEFLPMLCQHCTNAPCEPVCPVYATYHTSEGLNTQVYNRCVGTRYCSNNCPYKVRTFNYTDPQFPAPLDFQLNPDVSVRSKGVMEKCTFCVQRIRYGENAAKSEKREVADGEIVSACAQTCPAEAIVFGDANDPTSRVSRWRREGRGFHVLDELNTLPAITYLARVKGDKP